jgi:hypothetical protein
MNGSRTAWKRIILRVGTLWGHATRGATRPGCANVYDDEFDRGILIEMDW